MSKYQKLCRKETLIDIVLATLTAKYNNVINVGIKFIAKTCSNSHHHSCHNAGLFGSYNNC